MKFCQLFTAHTSKKHDTQHLIGRIIFLTSGKSDSRHLIGCWVLRPACESNLLRAFSGGKSQYVYNKRLIAILDEQFFIVHLRRPSTEKLFSAKRIMRPKYKSCQWHERTREENSILEFYLTFVKLSFKILKQERILEEAVFSSKII